MSKQIKITPVNSEIINEWLQKVNKGAYAHVFNNSGKIFDAAEDAERQLSELGIPQYQRHGAKFVFQSGQKLPKSYRFVAQTTTVTIVRRSSGWFIETIVESHLYPNARPAWRLTLTADQDAKAIENLRQSYSIAP